MKQAGTVLAREWGIPCKGDDPHVMLHAGQDDLLTAYLAGLAAAALTCAKEAFDFSA